MEYIRTATEVDAPGCIFCDLPVKGDDEAHVLARGEHGFVILNAYPYNPGHLMVAPWRHTGEFHELTVREHTGLMELQRRAVVALREEMEPHGFNIGMNVGKVAGAGFPGHLHWHVVPRWTGDTNFMPIIGQTRVLPELLDETYRRLKPRMGA
ncbi:MAG: HIT domain-containing protein [Actinomycetota bacterium]